MERARESSGHERREPGGDERERDGDAPENQPDEVRERQEQAEEDGQPRASQVVVDRDPDRLLGGGLGGGGVERVAARIAVREEEDVAEGLGRVPEAVGDEVAEAHRGAPEGHAGPPAEERDHDRDAQLVGEVDPGLLVPASGFALVASTATAADANGSERARQRDRGRGENPPERRLPAVLAGRLLDRHVDRIAARLPGEAGVRVRREKEVGAQVGRVAHVGRLEAVEPARKACGEEDDEPAEDRHEEDRDPPQDDPDDVRDGEEDPEEHGQARPREIVLDVEPDGMRLHRRDYRHRTGRLRERA